MSIPTAVESLSTTAASNGPSGSDQRTLADDGLRQAYAFIAQITQQGADIASGATITPTSVGWQFDVTGTTGISTIATTNSWAGRLLCLQFDGALTLTHSSNLALPGSANITTAAGDVALFLERGSGAWRCISYQRADGSWGFGPISASAFVPTGSTVPANGLYLPGANDVGIASNTTVRWDVNSTGNHVFAAPSSGTAITATGVAGATIARFVGGVASDSIVEIAQNSGLTWSLYMRNSDGALVSRYSTGSRDVLVMGQAGNVTINAPSSGIPLRVASTGSSFSFTPLVAIDGGGSAAYFGSHDGTRQGIFGSDGVRVIAGSYSNHEFRLRTNNTDQAVITTDGRLYGTALHNNAGSLTGTTNQYIASADNFTPTATGVTNITLVTAVSGGTSFERLGNRVHCTMEISVRPTSASTQTQFRVTLPIASNLANSQDLTGLAHQGASTLSSTAASSPGYIIADTVNDAALVSFYCGTDNGTFTWYLDFSYTIK
jgi:hypothetical protein